MQKKTHLLIILFWYLDKDPRVLREVEALRDTFDISIAALGVGDVPGVCHIPLYKAEGLRHYIASLVSRQKPSPGSVDFVEGSFWQRLGRAWRHSLRVKFFTYGLSRMRPAFFVPASEIYTPKQKYDVVLAVDVDTLPLAFSVATGAPVVFDAHEYFLDENEEIDEATRRLHRYRTDIGHQFVAKCRKMVTVSAGLAEQFAKDFAIPLPAVVYSGPEFFDLQPSDVLPGKIRLVHHGLALPQRRLDVLIDILLLLDERFTLDIYLDERFSAGIPFRECQEGYGPWLKKCAAKCSRVRVLPPIPMLELPRRLNKYDMELIFFPAISFSLEHCMPNKFFESIQARIGLAVGPSPDMARVIKERDLGVAVDAFSPEKMADALNNLTREDVQCFKQNAHAAASVYSAENNMRMLRDILLDVVF